MSRQTSRFVAMACAALLGLAPTMALAAGGSTDVTIRRLEERAASPLAQLMQLPQTGVEGQGWWLVAGGLLLIALALVAWRITRERSKDAHRTPR